MTTGEAIDLSAVCAQCAYDLRGINSERCPECGFVLSKQRRMGGEIPWSYRRARGQVAAFAQTVFRVTVGGDWLGRVMARPVSSSDARRFWLIAATIASLPLLAAFVYAWIRAGSLWFVTYVPDASMAGVTVANYSGFGFKPSLEISSPAWVRGDLVWPLSAGFSRPGLALFALWLFVLLGSGAPTYLFHPKRLDEVHRQRANAFSYYLVAPLVFAAVPLTVLLGCAFYALEKRSAFFSPPIYFAALALITWLCVVALWVVRLLKTLWLTTGSGPIRMLAAALFLPAAWLGSALFALLFVPWCVGLAWLFLDALR